MVGPGASAAAEVSSGDVDSVIAEHGSVRNESTAGSDGADDVLGRFQANGDGGLVKGTILLLILDEVYLKFDM